jgi:phosphoribosyl 1,2-cyclic phosphate phosphodiesterase
MNEQASLLFLGTGGSMGIPAIGCRCAVCTSLDPHNKRLRPSALLQIGDTNLLIDCGPDFRYQALKYNLINLSGVVFTHNHYDHTAGVDELRAYYMHTHTLLPCLLSKETQDDLMRRFYYIFERDITYDKLLAKFSLKIFPEDRGETNFLGIPIHYFSYNQADAKVTGLRFGNLAYVTDIKSYPETIFEDLSGVDTLIVSALRFTPSALHFTVDEAVEFSRKVGAKKVWLTHISHEMDHITANAYLPEHIKLAYDGLRVPLSL